MAFRVDKTNHKLVTLAEHPNYHDSEVARNNVAVFDAIGYEVVRQQPVPHNLNEVVQRINDEGGLALVNEEVVVGLAKLFKVQPTVVEEMLHKATGNKEPINPITIRGSNGVGDRPRCLAIGRLWLTSTSVGEGQHKFDPRKPGHDMEKTMQLVSFEEEPKVEIFSHLVADEDDFINGIRELRQQGQRAFKLTGSPTRGEANKRDVIFSKARRGDDWVLIVNFYTGTVDTPVQSTVMLDYNKFDTGLGHLFVKGELVFQENN